MKLRQRRKQFWWTWHCDGRHPFSTTYDYLDWGVGRINHQHKGVMK